MSAIDEILELLKDGRWRNLNEIVEKTRLSKFKVEIVTNFLAEYDFIQLDKERKKARLTPATLNFLRSIQQIEGEMSESL